MSSQHHRGFQASSVLFGIYAIWGIVLISVLLLAYHVPSFRWMSRHSLYLVFGAIAVRSLVVYLRLVHLKTQWMDASEERGGFRRMWLPIGIPVSAALLILLMAVGGLGISSMARAEPYPSRYVVTDPNWVASHRISPADAWQLFIPMRYYEMIRRGDIIAEGESFRPLLQFVLWALNKSLLMCTVVVCLVHGLNAGLLAWLAWRWGGDRWIAAASATLFAWHPVTWISMSQTSEMHVSFGAAMLLAALALYDQFCRRQRLRWLLGSALVLALSSLFVEMYLGAVVFFWLLTDLLRRTKGLRAQAVVCAWMVLAVAVGLTVAFHLFIMTHLALHTRFYMLVTSWKHLALTAFFEPQFAFFHPVEDGVATWSQVLFAAPMALLAGLTMSSGWGALAAAAYLGSSFSLGPAMTFFEMTGGWSGGRLAYAPTLLLCLAFGLVRPTTRLGTLRVRGIMFLCAISALAITVERLIRF